MIDWQARTDARRLAALRIGLAAVLLLDVVPKWRFAVELYSSAGPATPLYPLFWTAPDPLAAVTLHGALIAVVMSLLVGWQTRLSLLLTLFLYITIGLMDGVVTFKKYSVLAVHALIILAMADAGKRWSLDAVRGVFGQQRRLFRNDVAAVNSLIEPPADSPADSPAWPVMAVRWLLACVYLGAAITKLMTPGFLSGDVIAFTLLDDQWGLPAAQQGPVTGPLFDRFPGLRSWLFEIAGTPNLCILAASVTVFSELIVFPVGLLWKPLRTIAVIAAILFHLVLELLLQIRVFTPLMLVLLAFCLDDSVWQRAFKQVDRVLLRIADLLRVGHSPQVDRASQTGRQQPAGSQSASWFPVGWPITVTAIVGTLVTVQVTVDWYGVFGRRSISADRILSQAEVALLTAELQPPASDWFDTVTLGSRVDRNGRVPAINLFRRQSPLYIGLDTPLPHPAMEVEIVVRSAEIDEQLGREIDRFEISIAASDRRISALLFERLEMPPGRYEATLLVDGVAVRRIVFDVD